MSIEFKLPEVGENIEKADVGNVKVAVGDVIAADQVVMEIETDKAVFDLPCPQAGKVAKIHVKPGQSVAIGELLLTLEETTGATTGPAPKSSPAPQSAPPPVASVPAPAAPAPDKAAPARETQPAAVATVQPSAAPATPSGKTNDEQAAPAPAGPATRRLARELGVDLHRVVGSGSGGRITPEDVQSFVKQALAGGAVSSGGAVAVPPLPDFSQFGVVERQPLNKVMRTGAANLSLAWSAIPHVTQHELADVTELEAARKRYSHSAGAKEGGPKITMTVLAMKAVVTALKAFPRFNASFDAAAGEVVLKKYYHIGVAVDTENGLMVPVIRNVDMKSVVQLAAELVELAQKARDRKLTIAEMQGGSFTITNLGGIGGTYFTPIVNYPEVAILGMSRTTQQPVIVAGKSEIRLMLPLSLSYDHRVINGADGARFIVKLSGLLSDPFQLLSEV
ncbi:MAG: pyruvate dehydrogenase [Planctomycetaceae bacterium]|nr:pyruvate dehydrogenase [Planctomycetaceae bacterium]